jgi:hypothetical protein
MKPVKLEMFVKELWIAETKTADASAILSLMEEGKKYRCKEIAKLVRENKATRWCSIAYIASLFKTLVKNGCLTRIVEDGEPVEVDAYIYDFVIVNGEKYYNYDKGYWGTKTVIPKITYYSLA